jgi:hypothetical protein
VAHAQRAQLLRQANTTYHQAIAAREDRAAFLLALQERLDSMSAESRQRMLVTVHAILRDQVAFSDACLDILDAPRRP